MAIRGPRTEEEEEEQLRAAILASLTDEAESSSAAAEPEPEGNAECSLEVQFADLSLSAQYRVSRTQSRAFAATGRVATPGGAQGSSLPPGVGVVAPKAKATASPSAHYAVWEIPGRPELAGVWSGPFPAVWHEIQSQLPGGVYGPGCRLRRAPSLDAAVELYKQEAARHGVPDIPAIHLR